MKASAFWLLLFCFPGASAFTCPSLTCRTTSLGLYNSVEEAIAEAQRICSDDPDSERCKVAWDIVEELEAADSHRNSGTSTTGYVDYWPMVNALDILCVKIDRKLDELKKLSSEMAHSAPEIERLVYMSDEMKQALIDARSVLPREY